MNEYHGDEDEVKYTWDEIDDMLAAEADIQNDEEWLNEH